MAIRPLTGRLTQLAPRQPDPASYAGTWARCLRLQVALGGGGTGLASSRAAKDAGQPDCDHRTQ